LGWLLKGGAPYCQGSSGGGKVGGGVRGAIGGGRRDEEVGVGVSVGARRDDGEETGNGDATGSGSVKLEFGVGGIGVGCRTERAPHLVDALAARGLNVDDFSHLVKWGAFVHGGKGKSGFLLAGGVLV